MTENAQPPAFLADVERQAPSADRLTRIKDKAKEARDLTLEISNLQERIETATTSLNEILTNTLPSMLNEVGLDSIGVEGDGNTPAYDAELKDVIRANIAAKWDENKKAAGYNALERFGAATLIKTVCIFEFDRTDRTKAKELLKKADELGFIGEEKLSVHAQTLGAWLRAEVKAGRIAPTNTDLLNAIGGYIGKAVELKKRRAD